MKSTERIKFVTIGTYYNGKMATGEKINKYKKANFAIKSESKFNSKSEPGQTETNKQTNKKGHEFGNQTTASRIGQTDRQEDRQTELCTTLSNEIIRTNCHIMQVIFIINQQQNISFGVMWNVSLQKTLNYYRTVDSVIRWMAS